MKRKIEGLLISKFPYKDRHLIGRLLLREGKIVPVIFYGGQGGGKKKRSSTLELGYMLQVELSVSKSTSDIYHAKEWTPKWTPENIRLNHKAFYLMCLYLEMIQKLAPEGDLHDKFHDDDQGHNLFVVLSNALFYLEKMLKEKNFNSQNHLLIFMGKLLIDQGVFPQRDFCTLTDRPLQSESLLHLVADHGGFACAEGLNQEQAQAQGNGTHGRELWEVLGRIGKSKYLEIVPFDLQYPEIVKSLFHYFCYQFHFQEKEFKSYSMAL